MSFEENRHVISRLFEEVFNARKLHVLDELVDENVVNHEVTGIVGRPGIEGFRVETSLFLDAFPDATITAEDQIAEGDKVVIRWRLQGEHQGDFAGIPATGHLVDVVGIIIYRLEHFKIVETWGVFDLHGLIRQLQLI